MFPNPIFTIEKPLKLSLTLYEIMFFLGLVAAFVVFTVYTNKKKMSLKAQSFYQNLAIGAIAGGYLFSFLFQAVYNYFETGIFEFRGITFLGGLIGGTAVFLFGYKIFAKDEAKKYFHIVLQSAPCCVLIAHSLGRIGCFFAGCCYGMASDGIFGMYFPAFSYKILPTQLFEAAFLFIMFVVTSRLYFKEKGINVTVYMLSYGIFRFFIEFIRGDITERGDFIISFLYPSQTLSLLMVISAVIMLFLKKKL